MRSLTLQIRGDSGQGDAHRVAGWISQEIVDRTGPNTRVAIWSGRAGVDNVRAVGRGEVDLALVSPASFVRMAATGSGAYRNEKFADLVALGTIPRPDRLVFAVSAGTGIRSFKDLRDEHVPLRIATAPNDGVEHTGMGVHNILDRQGVPRATIESWGGRFIEHQSVLDCLEAVKSGEADAIFQATTPAEAWKSLAQERTLNFISLEESVVAIFEKVGWPRSKLPVGTWRGVHQDLLTMDFSDLLIVCRPDLPDDIASLIAWCVTRTRWPFAEAMDLARAAATPIPLHPAAEVYFTGVRSQRDD